MISIVIPTLNEGRYLPKLLGSIKKQTYKDYELIVSDNFSKDNTRRIAKKYGCRVVDGGLPGKARNNGAKAAKYDLVFIDADIVLADKSFLKIFLEKIKKENLDIATCKVLPDSGRPDYRFYYFLKNWFNKNNPMRHISGQCFFIKKELFESIGGYDETLQLGEEHDLVRRGLKHKARYKFLAGHSVINSTRRLEKEGFFRLLFKSACSELYAVFFRKIKRKLFDYEFGNYQK
ncbi:TPA: glycosyltransferase [Candidatus Woesearchaeota archaeon]|nr:Glycosyl transferase family 2 [archaeon GW2011_AR15]MBS3103382.1 glycosyltransferase [Candidatus Woesearchaeota archaeon]HIH41499.1 glycosyltransferase [Candidatus Woesearchaeota archaeon]